MAARLVFPQPRPFTAYSEYETIPTAAPTAEYGSHHVTTLAMLPDLTEQICSLVGVYRRDNSGPTFANTLGAASHAHHGPKQALEACAAQYQEIIDIWLTQRAKAEVHPADAMNLPGVDSITNPKNTAESVEQLILRQTELLRSLGLHLLAVNASVGSEQQPTPAPTALAHRARLIQDAGGISWKLFLNAAIIAILLHNAITGIIADDCEPGHYFEARDLQATQRVLRAHRTLLMWFPKDWEADPYPRWLSGWAYVWLAKADAEGQRLSAGLEADEN